MKNKTIANWLIAALVVFTLGSVMRDSDPSMSETLYAVGGLALFVFSIISIVRFYKLPDQRNNEAPKVD